MKKQMIIAAVFAFTALFLSASEKKNQRTSAEIFAEYGKMAQEEREGHIGASIWGKAQQEQLDAARNGKTDLKPEQIAELAKEQRIHLHELNKKEWEAREKYRKQNEKECTKWKKGLKAQSELFVAQENLLQEANKYVKYYNSWSPIVLWTYCFSNDKYKELRSKAYEVQKEVSDAKAKHLYATVTLNYEAERKLLEDNRDTIFTEIISEKQNGNDTKHKEKLLTTLQKEIKASSKDHHFNAFVRTSLPKQHDRELFQEYRNRVSKE